jgi:hypothetical protein
MTIFMKLGDIKAFGCREVIVAWCYASTVCIATFLNLARTRTSDFQQHYTATAGIDAGFLILFESDLSSRILV